MIPPYTPEYKQGLREAWRFCTPEELTQLRETIDRLNGNGAFSPETYTWLLALIAALRAALRGAPQTREEAQAYNAAVVAELRAASAAHETNWQHTEN
jgi:hypothetical protein